MTTFTGANAVGAYRIEDTFNTEPADNYRSFGRNVTIDTFEGANNGTELYEFCQRTPTDVIEQNFEGSWSASFVLSTFQFLEIFDTDVPDDLDTTDAGVDVTVDFENPTSFEMAVSRKESSTDITRVATGCIATSLEIDAQVDGTVEVSIDGIYADEEKRTGTEISETAGNYSQIDADKDALNFADVTTLDFKGTSLELPQGVTISLENNMTLLSVLGSRTAGSFTTGSLTGTVDFSQAVEVDDTATLESMYGASGGVSQDVPSDNTMTITMSNGNTEGSGLVEATWNLTGFTESYSESGIDVEEDFVSADVTETLTGDINVDITEG